MRSSAILLATLLLLSAPLAAGATPRPETGSASFADAVAATLGGSWVVTIEGSKRPRTLTVFGLAATGFGAVGDTVTLDGAYGYADGTQYPTRITAHGARDDFEIAFVSSAKARLRARPVSPTELRGTFEFKNETRPVVLQRPTATAMARRDSKITVIYIGAFD